MKKWMNTWDTLTSDMNVEHDVSPVGAVSPLEVDELAR